MNQNQFRAKNTPLSRIILQAYLAELAPAEDRLKAAPSWVLNERFDITAKVDDATADSWKGMSQREKVPLVAPLLRAMLEERCKLVAHTVPTELQGYALVLGKHPLKLKHSQPDEPLPPRYVRLEGGWMLIYPEHGSDAPQIMGFRHVTMAQLIQFLSMGGPPIVDQTGLKGSYDFDLPKFDITPPPVEEGAAPPPPARPDVAHMFDWEAVGLEMKPIKVPGVNLVIDHIERPSEN